MTRSRVYGLFLHDVGNLARLLLLPRLSIDTGLIADRESEPSSWVGYAFGNERTIPIVWFWGSK